jgi:transcriptional regulator with XRE-family HTH domain
MIKNERQYQMSKAQIREFENAMAATNQGEVPDNVHPDLLTAQKNALQSQIEELAHEVMEYEALKEGKITSFEAQSLEELPILLVKARIARGVTHKELADRLLVKEQQVQRWEFNDFSGASLDNLKAIANALGVVFTQKLYVPKKGVTAKVFLDYLSQAGLSTDFLLRRIVPDQVADAFRDGTASFKEIVQTAGTVGRVFDLKTKDLVELTAPKFNFSLVAATKFKLPSRRSKQEVTGYTIYAHYLAALVAECVDHEQTREFPTTAHEFFAAVSQKGEPMTFGRVISFLWDCGIAVLPLADAGGFHGAVWKISGRFVMVLKQATPLESRWLYDALHESGHIKNGDVTDDVALIEDQEISPESSIPEEEAANEWAEDALFDSRSEEIELACTRACRGKLPALKSALPQVATDFNINLGAIANHMAYRLAQQRQNWWGAAHNLQEGAREPFDVAREILIQNTNLFRLSDFDRALLQRAINEE